MWNRRVAEILSRSRKVRTQIPNKADFVTARDDGAKGQHHSKAWPGPDWPALPELGGHCPDFNGAAILDPFPAFSPTPFAHSRQHMTGKCSVENIDAT